MKEKREVVVVNTPDGGDLSTLKENCGYAMNDTHVMATLE
jgi:hypothetical protein